MSRLSTVELAYGYVMKRLQATQTRLLKILLKLKRRDSATEMYKKYQLLNCRQIYKTYLSTFVYKQQNGLLPCTFDKRGRITRQSHHLYIPKYRTTQGQRTIKYTGAKLWNELPENIRLCNSLCLFKNKCS